MTLQDIIHSNIRFIPIILGSCLGPVLSQTRVLLWFPRSRDPQPHHLILERQILVPHLTRHQWDIGRGTYPFVLSTHHCCFHRG